MSWGPLDFKGILVDASSWHCQFGDQRSPKALGILRKLHRSDI